MCHIRLHNEPTEKKNINQIENATEKSRKIHITSQHVNNHPCKISIQSNNHRPSKRIHEVDLARCDTNCHT